MEEEGNKKVVLLVVDGSKELDLALHYACKVAKEKKYNIALACIIEPHGQFNFIGIGDVISDGDREEAEIVVNEYANRVYDNLAEKPIIFIKQGDKLEEIINIIKQNKDIISVVLGANEDQNNPGILVSQLTQKHINDINIPIIIIPGGLTKEEIDNLI